MVLREWRRDERREGIRFLKTNPAVIHRRARDLETIGNEGKAEWKHDGWRINPLAIHLRSLQQLLC